MLSVEVLAVDEQGILTRGDLVLRTVLHLSLSQCQMDHASDIQLYLYGRLTYKNEMAKHAYFQ